MNFEQCASGDEQIMVNGEEVVLNTITEHSSGNHVYNLRKKKTEDEDVREQFVSKVKKRTPYNSARKCKTYIANDHLYNMSRVKKQKIAAIKAQNSMVKALLVKEKATNRVPNDHMYNLSCKREEAREEAREKAQNILSAVHIPSDHIYNISISSSHIDRKEEYQKPNDFNHVPSDHMYNLVQPSNKHSKSTPVVDAGHVTIDHNMYTLKNNEDLLSKLESSHRKCQLLESTLKTANMKIQHQKEKISRLERVVSALQAQLLATQQQKEN